MSRKERNILTCNDPVIQAIAFDEIVVGVFDVMLGILPTGMGTRKGTRHANVAAGHIQGIWERGNAIFANIEAQRMMGLHAHACSLVDV